MKINAITNPTDDLGFRHVVERVLDAGARNPGDLQLVLRQGHPRATVVRGIEEAGIERWYVYRDGRWIRSS